MLVSKSLFGKSPHFALAAVLLSSVSTACLAGDEDKEQEQRLLRKKKYEERGEDSSVEDPSIQFDLAYMYETGQGRKKNYKKAEELYTKSAKQGYIHARFNLWDMYDRQLTTHKPSATLAVKWFKDRETSKTTQKGAAAWDSLPALALENIFSYLSGKDLLKISVVSKRFKNIAERPEWWSPYITQIGWELPQENNLYKITVSSIFRTLNVNQVIRLAKDKAIIERFISLGYKEAFNKKRYGLLNGKYGFTKSHVELKEFNEVLVSKRNPQAIERKLDGLLNGGNGYKKNLVACGEFNEELVAEENAEGIEAKIYGLANGNKIYNIDLEACREFIEELVAKENAEGIKSKIHGLSYGSYGYKKDLETCRKFIEELVTEGNAVGIITKLYGLEHGRYGYTKNLEGYKKLNDELVAKGDPEAIERKIEGLKKGKYDYAKNLDELRTFIKERVAKGNIYGINLKIKGIKKGKFSNKIDPEFIKKYITALEQLNNR